MGEYILQMECWMLFEFITGISGHNCKVCNQEFFLWFVGMFKGFLRDMILAMISDTLRELNLAMDSSI